MPKPNGHAYGRTDAGADVAARLSPLSHDLDELMGELGAGVRSAQHFDELDERGAQIATGIRRAFRGGACAMIDLNVLRDYATGGPGGERVPITRQALAQIVRELQAGRAALATVQAQRQLNNVMLEIGGAVMPAIDVGSDG